MTGGGGSTTTTKSGPPPEVLAAYKGLTNAATQVAGNPLQQYTGPMVAGFTPAQQQGFAEIENAQGIGLPYLNAAAQMFGTATTPLWPTLPQYSAETVGQYLNPYTENVTKALTDLYNQQNATQASTIAGDAAMHGAYGGDREVVAQALAAEAQNLSQAPTLAKVLQEGFQGAVGEFNEQQRLQLAAEQANAWLASQAGAGFAGLGKEALAQALTGANALISSGALQQQLAQEQINIPYQQFLQQQGYPYQQLGFLAPIVEGTGSLSGGTGSTTTPGPSALSQIAGLGTAGLGLYGLGSDMGWWGGGGGGFDYPFGSWGGGGDFEKGGRVGYGFGGSMPSVPGVGPGVPQINLDYIPHGVPGPSANPMMGLSPFQPNVEQTTKQSGGGIMDVLGPVLSVAKFALPFFLAEGGRAGRDGIVGDASANRRGMVPAINLDYISHPGPAVKGSGPPRPPAIAAPADQGVDASKMLGMMGGLKDVLGSSGTPEEAAEGGRISLQSGGVPVAVAAQFGGEQPNVSDTIQQLLQMPLGRLEQMAVQYPPTTRQGQMVAQALARKKATPGAGAGPAAPTAPTAASFAPQQGISPERHGGTSHAMADGGSTGFVTEDELDPYPVVDTTGATVKIRYPSEGRELDLGIPTLNRPSLAAGGPAGLFPQMNWDGGQWAVSNPASAGVPHTPILGPANNAPLLGTSSAENAPGTSAPFFTSMPTASGVAIPQLSASAFAPPAGVPAGEGLPGWFAPLDQYRPPGAGPIGPGGTMVFPSATAYLPQARGYLTALGFNQTPVWAGGIAPSPTTPAPVVPTPPPTDDTQRFLDWLSTFGGGGDGGGAGEGKRGGRIGLAEGGSSDAPVPIVPPGEDLIEKLRRIEDLHRENIEDPFPSFQRIIGVPTGRPGGGGFADGGKTFDPSEYIEPPGIGYRPPSGIGASPQEERPPAPQPAPPALPPRRKPSPPRFAEGGDIEDPFAPAPGEDTNRFGPIPADAFGSLAVPDASLTPAGFPANEPLGTKVMRAVRGDRPEPGPRQEYEAPFTPKRQPTGFGIQPADRAAEERIGIAAPPSGIGAGTGEPAAPEAMVTADRAPPGGWAPGTIWGTGDQAPGLTPPPGGWGKATEDKPPGSRGTFPPDAVKFNSRGEPYNPGSPGGVEAGMPGAGPVITKEDAAKANAGVAPGTAMPVMPTDFIWGPGKVAPPGAGMVTPAETGAPAAAEAPAAPVDQLVEARPPYISPGAPLAITTPGQANVRAVLDTAKEAGLSPGATAALIANGLGEGGFNDPWQKAWGKENSFGHWQFNQRGELPGYLAWLQANGLPNDSRSQTLYTIKRMEEISPGWSKLDDARRATDIMGVQFEKYRGAAPGQRYSLLDPASKIMAGDFSVALGPTRGTAVTPVAARGVGERDTGDAVQQASAVAQTALANTPPAQRSAMANWMNSPYFMLFLAGAGMLASKSPFPGVAVGEGLKLAAQGALTARAQDTRAEAAAARAQHMGDLTAVRLQSAADKAAGNAQMMQYRYDTLARQLQADQNNLELKRQTLEANAAKNQANLELAHARLEAGVYAPPYSDEGPSDPNDPNSPKVRGTWYRPKNPNSGVKPMFLPGVAGGRAATLEERMVDSGQAKDVAEARRTLAEAARDPDGFKKSATYTRLVQAEKTRLQRSVSAMQMSEAQLDAAARRAVDADLAKSPGAQTARPTASATPPSAPATPGTPPPVGGAPAWARGQTTGPNGRTIYTDGKGWYNADRTPYQP